MPPVGHGARAHGAWRHHLVGSAERECLGAGDAEPSILSLPFTYGDIFLVRPVPKNRVYIAGSATEDQLGS